MSKVPKLNLENVNDGEKVEIQVVNNGDNEDYVGGGDDSDGCNLINKQLKSQIQIYKKTIGKYKEKINKMRKQIRTLIDKNSLLINTLKMYVNKKPDNNKNNNDVSMNPNINDLSNISNISSNSAVFGRGTVENINKLNEINKMAKINQITNAINSKIANKGDPLANIIIKENHYKNEITTKDSSNNN